MKRAAIETAALVIFEVRNCSDCILVAPFSLYRLEVINICFSSGAFHFF